MDLFRCVGFGGTGALSVVGKMVIRAAHATCSGGPVLMARSSTISEQISWSAATKGTHAGDRVFRTDLPHRGSWEAGQFYRNYRTGKRPILHDCPWVKPARAASSRKRWPWFTSGALNR